MRPRVLATRPSLASEPRVVSSHWMDASHKEWFGGLFAEFRQAIADGIRVGPQTIDAVRCVETIMAAYESAVRNSQEVFIDGGRSTGEIPRRARCVCRRWTVSRSLRGSP